MKIMLFVKTGQPRAKIKKKKKKIYIYIYKKDVILHETYYIFLNNIKLIIIELLLHKNIKLSVLPQ